VTLNQEFLIPNSTQLELIMGNSNSKKAGIEGLTLRDLRLWSGAVNEDDSYSWRHRQLDVNNF
jgi:hypothetical protein